MTEGPPGATQVNKSGIGVGLKPMPSLAPEEIAQAICTCRETAAIREKAREVGLAMEKEPSEKQQEIQQISPRWD